jgi:hypothetical protein
MYTKPSKYNNARGLNAFVVAALLSPLGVFVYWIRKMLYERGAFRGLGL